MIETVKLDQRDRGILQWLQDEFPVTERPWRRGGERMGMPEEEVLSRVRRLSAGGVIRSVHTILDKQKTGPGSSTLIAMRVPEEKIQKVVSIINEYPSVTHNYQREHEYNLWFTVNTKDERELIRTIEDMEKRTGMGDAEILDLRTIRVFKTDVRFIFSKGSRITRTQRGLPRASPVLDETDRAILRMTQKSIPVVHEPFRQISEQLGIEQGEVLTRLERQMQQGVIRRIGGSFDQRKLGIVANAVVAWKVPEDQVMEIGKKFSMYDQVTHCYERRTVPGVWDYNMFIVLHGHDRTSVETCAKRLSEMTGIGDYRVMFSTKQFKRTSIIHDLQNVQQNEK